MTVLISEHGRLYQREEPETEIKIPRQQQNSSITCKVEWLTQEDTDPQTSSGTGDKTPKEKPDPCNPSADNKPTAPSPVTTSEACKGGTIEGKGKSKTEEKTVCQSEDGESEVAGSPSRQSKAPPAWKTSFKGSAASGGSRVKIGGSAGDVSATGGTNWLMNGLSSLRAHRRTTSSGERVKDSSLSLKDSTLSLKETPLSLKDSQRDCNEDSSRSSLSHRALHQSHRLSAYDNVAPSTLSRPADTSSIWTAFEISLVEPEGSNNGVKSEQDKERPTEERDSDTVDNNGSCSEEDLTNEGLTDLVTELKQELKKQRTSYETRIRK